VFEKDKPLNGRCDTFKMSHFWGSVQFGGKLGSKKETAVLALLSSRSVDEAAHAAAVTPRTLYRWMNEREFSAAFREDGHNRFQEA